MKTDAIKDWAIVEDHDAAAILARTTGIVGRVFRMRDCNIIVSLDPHSDGRTLWHLSISGHGRDPAWQEIVTARYRLLPDVPEMAMFLPPLDEYVNLHPHTFHLHEVPRGRIILP